MIVSPVLMERSLREQSIVNVALQYLGMFICVISYMGVRVLICLIVIKKACLFKYTENFTTKKWKTSDKNSDIFLISAQNIYCG